MLKIRINKMYIIYGFAQLLIILLAKKFSEVTNNTASKKFSEVTNNTASKSFLKLLIIQLAN